MDLCLHNLAAGLQADACGEDHAQLVFTLSSRSGLAASAIALPDFYRKFREWVGADALLLGVPDPSTLLVCDAGAEKPKRVLTEAVRESDYAEGGVG